MWEGGREGEVTKIPAVILQLISNLEPMWLNYTEPPPSPKHRSSVVAYFLEVFAWREADETEKKSFESQINRHISPQFDANTD